MTRPLQLVALASLTLLPLARRLRRARVQRPVPHQGARRRTGGDGEDRAGGRTGSAAHHHPDRHPDRQPRVGCGRRRHRQGRGDLRRARQPRARRRAAGSPRSPPGRAGGRRGRARRRRPSSRRRRWPSPSARGPRSCSPTAPSTRPSSTAARPSARRRRCSAHAARARRQLAGKTLGDLVIKAPFAGIVADRFVNPGEYVRPDSKVATVVQLDAAAPGAVGARERAGRLRRRGRGGLQGGGLAGRDLHRQGALRRRHRAPGDARPAGRGGGGQQGRAPAPGHVRGGRGEAGRGDAAGGAQGRPAHRRARRHRPPVRGRRRPGGGAPGAHRASRAGDLVAIQTGRQGGRAGRAGARPPTCATA